MDGENNIKALLVLRIMFIFSVLMGRKLITCAMGICKKNGNGADEMERIDRRLQMEA